MALYRNNRDNTFTDVTETAGLTTPLYGMGVAVADYDNDGDPDIYISTLETDRLFQNTGNGTFVDVTEAAGIHNPVSAQAAHGSITTRTDTSTFTSRTTSNGA